MRLLLVELDRLRSRRSAKVLVGAAVLLAALLAGTAAWETRPVTVAERAGAAAQATVQASAPEVVEDLRDCRADPQAYFGRGADPAVCERFLVPQTRDFLPRQELDLGAMLDGRGLALVTVVTGLLVVAGATFAGGDYGTGSIATQLLFRPRRGRLWLAKAGAVLVGAGLAAAVVLGGYWAAMTLLAEARGTPVPAEVLEKVRWTVLRGTGLAAAAAVGGYALSMLLRGTVATLGALFAYVLAGEAVVAALPVDRASRFGLSDNVFAWVQGGTRVVDPGVRCAPGTGPCETTYQLGLGHGAAYLGVLLALAVLVSLLAFRRRDV